MVEFRSALASRLIQGRFGAANVAPPLTLSEQPLGFFFQIAGWPGEFDDAVRPVMSALGFSSIGRVGQAQEADGHRAFRIAPERVLVRTADPDAWGLANDGAKQERLTFLDLSHARSVFRLIGSASPDLLARLVSIDLYEGAFPVNAFSLTGIHSVPVMLHRLSDEAMAPSYDLFVPYSWAASLWDLTCHTALPFGYEVTAGIS